MKRYQLMKAGLIAAGLLAGFASAAQNMPATNRLTFSGRFGLNISAKFSGAAPIAVPVTTRTTPNSATYNYDDGYVLPDVSGSGDGLTWNWGYDDSSSQVDANANTILLSRSSGLATLRSPGMDDNPSLGCELTYTHQLGTSRDFRYGFEAALNYLNIGMKANNPYALTATRATDAFPFFAGTTPPGATPTDPYQGTSDGPGFVIGTTPVDSTFTEVTVGTVAGGRSLDADLWGGRIGPYLEYYLDDNVGVSLSGGLAVGWLDTTVSWNETVNFTGGGTLTDTGSGEDQVLLWGGYVAANLHWQLSERWTAAGSVQFQSLGQYEETFATRRVELDLSKSFFVAIGLSYDF